MEATFQMPKTKFGDSVNAKDGQVQFTETLLKILCHNIVVNIQEMRKSDIDPGFLSQDLDSASQLI